VSRKRKKFRRAPKIEAPAAPAPSPKAPPAPPAPFVLSPAKAWPLTAGWAILIAILVLAFYFPRLIDAHFGLLDDGVTLSNSRYVLTHPLSAWMIGREHGRWMPNYYWHYAIYYLIAGAQANLFYALHLTLLGVSAWLVLAITRALGASRPQSLLAALFFLLNDATVACYHTLSKSEPLQLVWLLAALALAFGAGWRRLVLAGCCMLLALLSKETSMAIAPAAVVWAGLEFWRERSENRARRFLLASLPALAVAGGTIFLVKSRVPASAYAGGYRLDLEQLHSSVFACSSWLLRSYFFALPLLFVLPLVWNRLTVPTRRGFVGGAIGWLFFFSIMLPWLGPGGYHFLVANAALGCALGFAAPELYALARGLSGGLGAILKAAVVLACLIFPLNVADSYTNSRAQLLVDRENARMLERLARLPQGARVAWNWSENEAYMEAGMHLGSLYGRPDIKLRAFDGDHRKWAAEGPYFIVTPIERNTAGLAIRLGLGGELASEVSSTVARLVSGLGEPRRETLSSETAVFDVAFDRLPYWWGAKSQNVRKRPFFWPHRVMYGWELYEVTAPAPPPLRWVGYRKDGTWEIVENKRVLHRFRFGRPGDVPVAGDFQQNGTLAVGVFHPGDGQWSIDLDLDGRADVTFRLPDTQLEDMPLVADWDGDGRDTPGLYRPSTSKWRTWNNFPPAGEPRTVTVETLIADIPMPLAWLGKRAGVLPSLYRPGGEILAGDRWGTFPWACTDGAPGRAQPVIADWSGFGIQAASFVSEARLTPRVLHCRGGLTTPMPTIQLKPDVIYFAGTWKLPANLRKSGSAPGGPAPR